MGASWAAAQEQNGFPAPPEGLLAADTLYRSVDEHGNVTYSQRPPAEAEEVEPIQVQPGPDRERRQEAKSRAQALQRAAQRAEDARREQAADRHDEILAAEEALRRARERLEKARIQREDDWQGLAGGGRRLKPSYHQRVQAAEAQVEAAEKRLHDARR